MAEATCVADVVENNAWRRDRPRNRSRKNRIKHDPPYSGWIEFGLSDQMVKGKNPINLSRIAPLFDMTLLMWEILYNGGKRTTQILDLYPDMLNQASIGGPPIGAAVYMNDIRSATTLLERGADLKRLYSFNRNYDGYHAIVTTPIVRAMITPGRAAMLQTLLQYASTDAKLYSLRQSVIISVPGAKERVLTLAACIPADAPFDDALVRSILEMFHGEFGNKYDQQIIDVIGDKFRGFLRNRVLPVPRVNQYEYQIYSRTVDGRLEEYIKTKYNATIVYHD